ncbi:3-hydroxyacyl-CoA dehydrogenase [Halomarina litorea]|uniref:3-hydroxyacyl-CoA dehydrogenase n=1 Tax=Halomarina litorea TaxID=2961595 RepID=UPI0020C50950|nr:3-hydroxyacyl-CoA dehydrogenase [Halomarina sp. BCD28]
MTLESVEDVERTAVIGAGEMGRGIAAVQALAGYEVTLQDIDAEQVEAAEGHIEWSYDKSAEKGHISEEEASAALDRLSFESDLETAVGDVDFVTEVVLEQQSIKAQVFDQLDEHTPDHAILATNTSGLNVTKLAEGTDRPSQVIGTHWFNPPMLMDLVEVIETEHTDPVVADLGEALVEDWGKTPIRCRKDVPSFIVNRCMRPYGEAAAWMAYYGEAEIEEVDSAMKYKERFPMGPFELADFTGGIQIRVEAEEDHLTDDRLLRYDTRVCPLLHELYDRGHYGRKADHGFYSYEDQDAPDIDARAGRDVDPLDVWAPVINEAAKMVQHDVATVEDVDTGARLGGNWPMGPFEKADEVGAKAVVRRLVELADRHEPFEKSMETLPCDLLVETAKANETFY